jgi:hypothetical protein
MESRNSVRFGPGDLDGSLQIQSRLKPQWQVDSHDAGNQRLEQNPAAPTAHFLISAEYALCSGGLVAS